jgi:hypothetical protein
MELKEPGKITTVRDRPQNVHRTATHIQKGPRKTTLRAGDKGQELIGKYKSNEKVERLSELDLESESSNQVEESPATVRDSSVFKSQSSFFSESETSNSDDHSENHNIINNLGSDQ